MESQRETRRCNKERKKHVPCHLVPAERGMSHPHTHTHTSVCVCANVCMYVCMSICMFVCMHIKFAFMFVCMNQLYVYRSCMFLFVF